MEAQRIQILLVEDDKDDYILTRDLLAEIPRTPCHLEWVKSYAAGLAAMAQNQHVLYLVDYRLDRRTGLDLLREAREHGCRGPIILLTGQGEREVDLEAMKAGAADYLIKGRTDASGLERSIRYAIERHQDREALRQAYDEMEKRVQERTVALREANDALQQANRSKDEFLAMLAHELRNPLAPIRTGLHVLRMPNATRASIDRIMHVMEQQVHHLTRLVDDLLDVSRITRGKIELRKEIIDLATVLCHAVETVRPLVDAHRHRLTISLPEEPVHLEADPTRLEQVFSNLLTNAVKYTEQGGHIELSCQREGHVVTVRVRDNGMGIAPDLLPRVFDMFTQSERGLARSQGGLGIGLTLVRSLVQMQGGSVTAHSDGPGQGSEFVVRLPVVDQAPDQPLDDAAKQAQASPRQLRVLVVEDTEAAAEMLVTLLKIWGHDVRFVYDGPAALVAARTFQPDVVLLDIGLPGMNGYDVARQLRHQAGHSRLMIAAVTGYGQEEDRRRSREAGFDEHMVKPINPAALEQLLAAAELLKEKPTASVTAGRA
ncbi:MAG TPA: response regulator [Gemmataceae bacterium]|nr:response regulator [Gemmataceae bacterium]